jgi:DNA-binding HxlR family transcriptional regulator
MPPLRYPQCCALARAAEIVGERWTLLIVRELLLGPKRFTDLRGRLDGVSGSVLAERLARLEERGLLARRALAPPAAAVVYELTEAGQALEPAVFALLRWGIRFLEPGRPGERLEADWLQLALTACARRQPTPARSFLLRVRARRREIVLRVAGGPAGTTVTTGLEPADASLVTDPPTLRALLSGGLAPRTALQEGRLRVEGDAAILDVLPLLFDVAFAEKEARAPA